MLEFQGKEGKQGMAQEAWEERADKFTTFFGPGISARLAYLPAGRVDVALVCDGSGAGRGGSGGDKEVLPPLMPGLPARQVAKQ